LEWEDFEKQNEPENLPVAAKNDLRDRDHELL